MKINKTWFIAMLLISTVFESSSVWRRRRRRRRRRRCNTTSCRWVYEPCTQSCGGGVNNPKVVRYAGACGRCDLPSPRPCNTHCCARDCVWSEWSLWDDECSVSCGGGTQYKSRSRLVEEFCGGLPCTGPTKEITTCNTQCCPVDCVWNEWQPYSDCSAPCEGGSQSRRRTILLPHSCGGAACTEDSVQRRECNTHCCLTNCSWGDWGNYGECTHTCGGGTKSRDRSVATVAQCGGSCDGEATESIECNTHCCAAVDCVWDDWGNYGECSKSCGGGNQTRNRTIARQASCNGAQCVGSSEEQRECNTHCCTAVDCVWDDWGNYGECSKSCGGGNQTRNRTIALQASCNGAQCVGSSEEQRECNTKCCAVDCVWDDWGNYGECSKSCGGGNQTRNRIIARQASCNGAQCVGGFEEQRECNSQCCAVDCVWDDWGNYGECSKTCGGGNQTRNRTIALQASCNGAQCVGSFEEQRICNDVCCPVNCVWNDWEEWSNCSKPCGTGNETAIRSYAVNATCGGSTCKGSNVKQRSCNQFCCKAASNGWNSCRQQDFNNLKLHSVNLGDRACVSDSKPLQVCETARIKLCKNLSQSEEDCKVTEWMEWSNCSAPCGGTGTSNRSRSISVMDACGGDPCPSVLWESKPCNRFCYNGGDMDDRGCICSPYWEGDCCQTNIDECNLKTHNCCDIAMCVNTNEGFRCECKPGYSGDGHRCLDVNECDLEITTCPQHTTCMNTEGSFHCACAIGFRSNGTACVDVDECVDGTNDCTGSGCVNTYGSYHCKCINNLIPNDGECVVPECEGNQWTDFFSADTPDKECDCEVISNLKRVYHQLICAVPTVVDARRIIDQVHWSTTGQNVTIDEKGFICMNTERQTCDDYEVRLCCPLPPMYACKEDDWTPYYNEDDPLLGGDFETLAILHHVLPDVICNRPTGIEARLEGSGKLYDPTQSNIKASPTFGFQCSNTDGIRCDDYEVRFCCHQAPPDTCDERHWTDYYDVDSPTITSINDIENLSELIVQHTEVCSSPTAMDVRLLSGDLYTVFGQIVHLSLVDGFQCFTEEQRLIVVGMNLTFERCKDYMVRYCCPPEQTNDQCFSWGGEWTSFFDEDDALREGGNGDYELLSSIRVSHPWVCLHPYDVQASIASNGSTIEGVTYDLSTTGGFRCSNLRTDCRSGTCKEIKQNCSNYHVRFCCPKVEVFDNNVDWCTVSNGQHYDTFDDSTFDFIGSCPLYLTKTNDKASKKPLHKFVVELETEKKSEGSCVIKRIIVRILTEVIEIRERFIIVVNGIFRSIPFFENFFGYNIRVENGMLRLDTEFGMFLRFDGSHIISVGLSDKYGDSVEGLCGNYDGRSWNDFSKQGNRSLCSYENFIVEKYYVDDKCNAELPDSEPCLSAQLNQTTAASCEAILKNLSCFAACTDRLDVQAFLQLCKDSTCNSPSTNEALKRFVEALIFECKVRDLEACNLSYVLSQYNIPLCPNGEIYTDCLQPFCEPTCLKPPGTAEQDHCRPVCFSGCGCNEGLVRRQEGDCVKFEDCPCLNEDAVPYLSADCTSQCTCTENTQSCVKYDCHRCVVSQNFTGVGLCDQEVAPDTMLHSSP